MIVNPVNADSAILDNIKQVLAQIKLANQPNKPILVDEAYVPVDFSGGIESYATLSATDFASLTLSEFEGLPTLAPPRSSLPLVEVRFYTDKERTNLLFAENTADNPASFAVKQGKRLFYTPPDSKLNDSTTPSTTKAQPVYYIEVVETLYRSGSDGVPQNVCNQTAFPMAFHYNILPPLGSPPQTATYYEAYCSWLGDGWTLASEGDGVWTLSFTDANDVEVWRGSKSGAVGTQAGDTPDGTYQRVSGTDQTASRTVAPQRRLLTYRNCDNLLFQQVFVTTKRDPDWTPNDNNCIIVPGEEKLKNVRQSDASRGYLTLNYDLYFEMSLIERKGLSEEQYLREINSIGNAVRLALYQDRYRAGKCVLLNEDIDGTYVGQVKPLPSQAYVRAMVRVQCARMVSNHSY